MIKSPFDELYNRLKNTVGFDRSPKFIKWLHAKYPGKIQHHCFGSYSQNLKTSDYCSVPLTIEEHEIAEKDKSNFVIDNIHVMLKIMIDYIKFLESRK